MDLTGVCHPTWASCRGHDVRSLAWRSSLPAASGTWDGSHRDKTSNMGRKRRHCWGADMRNNQWARLQVSQVWQGAVLKQHAGSVPQVLAWL